MASISEQSDIKLILLKEIRDWARNEFKNIEKEKTFNRNIPFAFNGIGDFGEYLCILMNPGSIGSASKGGCSYDVITEQDNMGRTKRALEVKFISLDGTKQCSICKNKAPRFQKMCLYCKKSGVDSTNNTSLFHLKCDSRAGIDSKAHFECLYSDPQNITPEPEKTEIIEATIIFISKVIRGNIKLSCFKFDNKNPYFCKYLRNQYENGSSNNANFQPFSYDWKLSGPIKLFELVIDQFENIEEQFWNLENKTVEPVFNMNWNTGKPVFKKKELENFWERSNLTVSKSMLETEPGVPYDYFMLNVNPDLRNKAHGKSRGTTNRK